MNVLMKLFVKGHVWLYRTSAGKRGATIGGIPVLLLSARGRKSGVERTVPVARYEEDGQDYVIASMAGSPKHPAWYLNLEANPEVKVQFGADRYTARAEILPREERDQVWQRIAAAMPNFAEYQKKTERVIPVVRLVRA